MRFSLYCLYGTSICSGSEKTRGGCGRGRWNMVKTLHATGIWWRWEKCSSI